jgi:long-chain acyl-CoA synthetase
VRELTIPPVFDVPAGANLTDVVWRNAEEHPSYVAFQRRSGGAWVDVTAVAFRDEVIAVARGLIARGVKAGDRVGLMAKTRYEWTLVDYGIWAAGAVTVPIYETSSAEQVQWILGDSEAVACVAETPEHTAVIEGLRGDLPDLGPVWQIEDGAVETLIRAGEESSEAEVEKRREGLGADAIATIIYTSGTTGRPKGCELTHRNMMADAGNSLKVLAPLFHDGSSTLLFLPLAHSFARLVQLGCVEVRATMGHSADVKNLLADFASFRPTFILSVPRVFEKVYNAAKQKAHAEGKGAIFDLAEQTAIAYSEALDAGGPGLLLRLKHGLFNALVYSKIRGALGGACTGALSGGAPLGARLAHFYRGVGITIYEGYGLTETSPATAVNFPGSLRLGTVGRPIPGASIRIADDGEVLIKGDHVFTSYWHNPAATEEALQDGWFHSGDIGSLSDEGYLTITGRKKEIIVTAGGKNVAPAVLEDRLRAHPLVSQCVVVGDARPFIGCLITIDPEAFPAWRERAGKPASATVADLADDPGLRAEVKTAVEEANKAVSRAEAIKAFRILPEDFTIETGELTPSLKVKRNVVLEKYKSDVDAIYR